MSTSFGLWSVDTDTHAHIANRLLDVATKVVRK